MQVLRTPDERFANLPDFPYKPHYTEISDASGVTCASPPSMKARATPRLCC